VTFLICNYPFSLWSTCYPLLEHRKRESGLGTNNGAAGNVAVVSSCGLRSESSALFSSPPSASFPPSSPAKVRIPSLCKCLLFFCDNGDDSVHYTGILVKIYWILVISLLRKRQDISTSLASVVP
jgi:hypothetical protein